MMKNIFMEVEYDGTDFYGWQIQREKVEAEVKVEGGGNKKVRTVQGEIERAIEKLFNRKIRVVYAGRTDRGVHARCQCVNFIVDTKIPLANIKKALNTFLPEDIFIKKVRKVPLEFHSRYSVCSKIYRYMILNSPNPDVFLRNYSWWLPEKLNIESMKRAAGYIVGERDFFCFARQAHRYTSTVRRIMDIRIRKRGRYVYIDIEATGFLRNMARNIVSLLVRVGEGELSSAHVSKIINGRISYRNRPAPACGLYLWKVKYA